MFFAHKAPVLKSRQPLVWPVLLFALFVMPTALASGNLFSFTAEGDDEYFKFQLIGREDPGIIMLDWSSSPGSDALPAKSYTIEMDRSRKTLTVRYKNPGDLSAPPSFTLKVKDGKGTLEADGHKLSGVADWGPF